MSENRIPDPFTVPLILIPCLVIPVPGAVIPDPTPFFCRWSLIPYTLLRPWASIKWRWLKRNAIRIFTCGCFLLRWDSMCWECATGWKRKEDGKPCVTNFLWKNFPSNRSFFKRPENINVKFTTNSQLIALSHLSHTSVLPLLEGKCRFHWVFNLFHGAWTTKL